MINYSCDCLKNRKLYKIVKLLDNNEVIIIPTDTVYGFVAKYSKENVEKINKLKNAPLDKPLGLITSNLDKVSQEVKWTPFQKREIKKYINTSTTVLVKSKNNNKIGLRIPEQSNYFNLFIQLINEVKYPLVSSSVNLHKQEMLNDFKSIKKVFKGKVSYIIKGKAIRNKASKIVDLSEDKTKIVRE